MRAKQFLCRGVRLGIDGVHLRPQVAWVSGAVVLLLVLGTSFVCGGSVLVFVLVCIALCPF